MNKWIKLVTVALVSSGLIACGGSSNNNDGDGEAGRFELTILHMNDHHSHLEEDDFDYDTSGLTLNAVDSEGNAITEVEVNYGGFARLVTLFNDMASTETNSLKIHAGDAITGTLYYSLFSGEADADMMNLVCFDAFALGNHEFDDGDSGLAGFLDHLSDSPATCQTPVLSANVVPGDTSAIRDGYIQPYTIKEIAGEQVGIIGINIAGKTKNSSQPDADTQFLDETTTAQENIDELTAMGINKIILVTHIQYANDIAMAGNLSGVDVIVGGDSHSLLGDQNVFNTAGIKDTTSGDYPTIVQSADNKNVCVVQAWEYARIMGKLNVTFDENGEVTACSGTPYAPISATESYTYEFSDSEDRVLEAADAAIVTAALTAAEEIVTVEEDVEALALLDSFGNQISTLEQTVIGTVAEDLCLERFPNQGRSSIDGCQASTYNTGSDISNIVAKAFLTVTQTADFAIQNGGGVRVDVAAGDYTIADAFTLLPFSNTLVTLEMTGEQIVAVLEDALANALDNGGSTGSYPYASGIRYNVDASAAFGNRVSNVEVNSRLENTWTAIDLSAEYTVVTNDFIASGRDGYTTFGNIFNAGLFEDTFTEYAQGFIDYVELLTENGETLSKLPLEEYSTQSYIGTDGCDHSAQLDCTGF